MAEADRLVRSRQSGRLTLRNVTALSTEAARVLAAYDGILDLSGLQSLSPQSAAELSRGNAQILILDGLSDLPESVAAALVEGDPRVAGMPPCSLQLNGLRTLSDRSAELLAQRGGAVVLMKLQSLTPRAAAYLAAKPQIYLPAQFR